MLRSIRIITLLLLAYLVPINIKAQSISESDNVVSLFTNLYSLHFYDAKRDLEMLATESISPDLLDVCIANYNWWMIITQENHDVYEDDLIFASNRILNRHRGIPAKNLSSDQLFSVIHAYAYKTRLELHKGKYMRGAKYLNHIIDYLEIVLEAPEKNAKFTLLAGLYHYLGGSILERYPLFKPVISFAPSMNKEEGGRLLQLCAANDHPMIRTEARYFLMKVQNDIEREPLKSDIIARLLLKEYPDNKYFRSCRINILGDAGNIKELRSEFSELSVRHHDEQISLKQHNFLIVETEKDLRKKRISL